MEDFLAQLQLLDTERLGTVVQAIRSRFPQAFGVSAEGDYRIQLEQLDKTVFGLLGQ